MGRLLCVFLGRARAVLWLQTARTVESLGQSLGVFTSNAFSRGWVFRKPASFAVHVPWLFEREQFVVRRPSAISKLGRTPVDERIPKWRPIPTVAVLLTFQGSSRDLTP